MSAIKFLLAAFKQGTGEYLEDVARAMEASDNPSKSKAGLEIFDALKKRPPKVEYSGVD